MLGEKKEELTQTEQSTQEEEQRKEEEIKKEISEKPKEADRKEKTFPRPWEEFKVEEKRLSTKYRGEELDEGTKTSIAEMVEKDIDRMNESYLLGWVESHKKELESEGSKVDEFSKERKIALAIKEGAFRDLKESPDYEKIREFKIFNETLKKEVLSPDDKTSLLIFLDKKTEGLKKEIEEIKRENRPEGEINLKRKELEEMFLERNKIAENITGRSFDKEIKTEIPERTLTQEEIKGLNAYVEGNAGNQKEKVKESLKREIFNTEWEKLSDNEKKRYSGFSSFVDFKLEETKNILKNKLNLDLKDFDMLTLLYNEKHGIKLEGLKIEGFKIADLELKKPSVWKFWEKLFKKPKIEIKKEGMKITKDIEDFKIFIDSLGNVFDKKIEEQAKEELEKEWIEVILSRNLIEEKIKKIIDFPEEVIKKMYEKIEDGLLVWLIEKELKKEPKTKEQIREIKEKYSQEGLKVPPTEVIRDATIGRGEKYKGSKGDAGTDAKVFKSVFEGYGIDTTEEALGYLLEKKIGKEKYKKSFEEEKGFLELILELIYLLFTGEVPKIDEKEKRKTRRSKKGEEKI